MNNCRENSYEKDEFFFNTIKEENNNECKFTKEIAMHIISIQKLSIDIIKELKEYNKSKNIDNIFINLKKNINCFDEILINAKEIKSISIKENDLITFLNCDKIVEIVNEEKKLIKELLEFKLRKKNCEDFNILECMIKNCLIVMKYVEEEIENNNFKDINIDKTYMKEYVINHTKKQLNKIKEEIYHKYGKDNKFLEFKILKNTSKYFLKDLNDVLDNEILGNLKYRIIAYKSFLRILNKETANKVDILRKEGTTINYTNECESYEKLMFLCEKYYTTFYDIEKEIEKIDYYDMITLKIHNKIVNAITLFQIFVGKIKENNINCDLTDYLIEGELLGFSSFNIYENISIIKDFFINMKGICNEVINSHDTNKYKFILKEWEIWLKDLIDKIHHLMIIYKENKNIKIYEIYNIVYDLLKLLELIIKENYDENYIFYKIKSFLTENKNYFNLTYLSKINYEQFNEKNKNNF